MAHFGVTEKVCWRVGKPKNRQPMSKLRDFFYLQRNDRQAIIAILLVLLLCLLGLWALDVVGGKDTSSQSSSSSLSSDSLVRHATRDDPAYAKDDEVVHEVFAFDPNTASAGDFERLGLQAWQVRSIMKYRGKGGVYRTPYDFSRVFGMTKKQFETLLPFIRIGEDYQPASNFYGRGHSSGGGEHQDASAGRAYHERGAGSDTSRSVPVYSYPHKLKAGERVLVNTADTADLMKIPGIGSYYAKRIIRYRDQLGGFANAAQVLEVDGVPEQAVNFIQVDAAKLRKLEINKLSVNQLRRHPYLNYYQAKEIFDYRRINGPITDINALRLLKEFPPDEIERLKPYLAY